MENKCLKREEISDKDKWDLSVLCKNQKEFDERVKNLSEKIKKFPKYKGVFSKSSSSLLELSKLIEEVQIDAEALSQYADMSLACNQNDQNAMEMVSKIDSFWGNFSEALSFYDEEFKSIDEGTLKEWIKDSAFDPFRTDFLEYLRIKEHNVDEATEKIVSLYSKGERIHENAFNTLLNSDIDFGTVNIDGKEIKLTPSNFHNFMRNKDRDFRKNLYFQYFEKLSQYKNTFSLLFSGVVQNNICKAQIYKYNSCLDAALFKDNINAKVLHTLIDTAHKNIHIYHRYMNDLKKWYGVEEMHRYDMSVPLFISKKEPVEFDDAEKIILETLKPLGQEYVDELKNGIHSRWIDKYENIGKANTSYHMPQYNGFEYILLHFLGEDPEDIYTLIHECGHAMHSLYSSRNCHYSEFHARSLDAEVASTFNENLLFRYLINSCSEDKKKFLIHDRIKTIAGYMFSQALYAEFELKCYELAEQGIPLTAEKLLGTWKELKEFYYGTAFTNDECGDVSILEIPHFYFTGYPFYIFKYAVSFAASMVMEKKLHDDPDYASTYLEFLKRGRKLPTVENLKLAGVDITDSSSITSAYEELERYIDILEKLND